MTDQTVEQRVAALERRFELLEKRTLTTSEMELAERMRAQNAENERFQREVDRANREVAEEKRKKAEEGELHVALTPAQQEAAYRLVKNFVTDF